MNIPDEALDAAAAAIAFGAQAPARVAEWWGKLPESERERYRKVARRALAAALPYLLARTASEIGGMDRYELSNWIAYATHAARKGEHP
jgi:hypothetical protein